VILLDTHALIWFLTSPEKLSVVANRAIEKDYGSTPILISSISIWETCYLVQKGTIKFTVPIGDWVTQLSQKSSFQFVPIDNTISYQSTSLPGVFHKDPADRFIVATARHLGATLITKDVKIRRYKHVKTLW
jgi:PIN domain nuclease of toxin-antitoxin system